MKLLKLLILLVVLQILVGKGKNSLLVLTNAGILHECSIDQREERWIGSLEEFLGLDL